MRMRIREHLKTAAVAAALAAAVWAGAPAGAQEDGNVVDVTVHNQTAGDQSQNVYDSGQTTRTDRQSQIMRELMGIEKDYTNVVKFYNKALGEDEALLIARLILYYSNRYGLDARLLMSVIAVESRFQPRAVSSKGAMGLGQLMPGTASGLGVKNAFSVTENVYGTARYLRAQYDRFAADERVLDLMLAAYNAGPEAVACYNSVPPYAETKNYVVSVKKLFRFFKYGY